jgi:hypothetical protein
VAQSAITSRVYTGRFLLVYVGLAAVLVAAVTGGVVLALKGGPAKPPPWSSWKPKQGSTQTMAGEIVSHVSRQYKLNAKGDQLVVVFPSAPEVNENTTNFGISTLAIRASASAQSFNRISATTGIIQQQYCGLGASCAISRGTATSTRERLVRREALEVALYTFKFVPSVKGVLAYLPPPPGQAPTDLLLLERSGLSKQLSEPLSRTLPLATPPLPSAADTKESGTIDRLTLPVEYSFLYQELPDKTQAIVLTPSAF